MRLSLIAIGKMRGSVYQSGFDQFQTRMQSPLIIREIDDKKAITKHDQGKLILSALPQRGIIVALDEHGTEWSSREFAQKIKQWGIDSIAEITFILGGADGISQEIRDRANYVFSLGRITLPHLLARLVLIEQIYRAQTINNNHPYHRD